MLVMVIVLSNRVGRIEKVSGAVVIVKGIPDIRIGEVVEVGVEKLIGEVVRVSEEDFTVQVYESTDGIRPGEPVYATGKILAAELGPGLITSIFDGIQRPLEKVLKISGPFIERGIRVNVLPRDKRWYFKPYVKSGDKVYPGDIIGEVEETPLIRHKIMIPNNMRGRITEIYEGEYRITEPVGYIVDSNGRSKEVKMFHEWPIRTPRPYKERLSSEVPLLTGLRVIDTFFPIAKGGAGCIPGGFGTGKTVTLHKISMYSDSEIVIYIGCGERCNEMSDIFIRFT